MSHVVHSYKTILLIRYRTKPHIFCRTPHCIIVLQHFTLTPCLTGVYFQTTVDFVVRSDKSFWLQTPENTRTMCREIMWCKFVHDVAGWTATSFPVTMTSVLNERPILSIAHAFIRSTSPCIGNCNDISIEFNWSAGKYLRPSSPVLAALWFHSFFSMSWLQLVLHTIKFPYSPKSKAFVLSNVVCLDEAPRSRIFELLNFLTLSVSPFQSIFYFIVNETLICVCLSR